MPGNVHRWRAQLTAVPNIHRGARAARTPKQFRLYTYMYIKVKILPQDAHLLVYTYAYKIVVSSQQDDIVYVSIMEQAESQ